MRLIAGRAHTGYVHIVLETPRLTMRQFTEDDVDNLFDLNSDPEVTRYLTGGEVEYALTKPDWQPRTAGGAH